VPRIFWEQIFVLKVLLGNQQQSRVAAKPFSLNFLHWFAPLFHPARSKEIDHHPTVEISSKNLPSIEEDTIVGGRQAAARGWARAQPLSLRLRLS